MKVSILLHTLKMTGEHQVVDSVHATKEGAVKALNGKGTSVRSLGNDIYEVVDGGRTVIYVITEQEVRE